MFFKINPKTNITISNDGSEVKIESLTSEQKTDLFFRRIILATHNDNKVNIELDEANQFLYFRPNYPSSLNNIAYVVNTCINIGYYSNYPMAVDNQRTGKKYIVYQSLWNRITQGKWLVVKDI